MGAKEKLGHVRALFAELCPDHRTVVPSWSRPDLDDEVQALWSTLGLSKATEWMAPRESAAKDEELLIEIFDEWLESPYLRDRWLVEREDGPLPRRMLPPKKPRLLGGNERSPRIILADEGEPGGRLYRFDGVRLEPLDLAYRWWCLHELLRQGTRRQCGSILGANIPASPAVPDLDTPLLRAADGVYVLQKSPLSNREGIAIPYRDLGCYARFVASMPDDVRQHFFDPSAFLISFKVKKSNKLLHPGQATAWVGFSRFVLTGLTSQPSISERAVGQLDGRWVWLDLDTQGDGSWNLLTDPADAEAVAASIVNKGATITGQEQLLYTISSPNW
jgi:hypothetical protein